MKTTPLESLADIRAGVTLRGPDDARPVPGGTVSLIRIGDLTDDGRLCPPDGDFPRLAPAEPIPPEQVLRPGDVLFPSRGLRTIAVVYRGEPAAPAIVGAQFFILRPRNARLDPDFLAWYLTTPAARQHFESRRGGSNVQFVPRAALADFLVPVPPLETQRRAGRLAELLRRERTLTERLLDRRRLFIESRLLRSL